MAAHSIRPVTTKDPWDVNSGLHAEHPFDTEYEYCLVLQWLIESRKSKNILELGAWLGHTTRHLLDSAEAIGGTVTVVDLKDLIPWGHKLLTRYECHTDKFFERGDDAKFYDFIYVDAGHQYEQACRDIVNAKKNLLAGGVIAVHDTAYNDPPLAEVKRAVEDTIQIVGGQWLHFRQGKGLSIGLF